MLNNEVHGLFKSMAILDALCRKQPIVGNKADKYEDAVGLDFTGLAGVDLLYIHGTHFVSFSLNAGHNSVPDDLQYYI